MIFLAILLMTFSLSADSINPLIVKIEKVEEEKILEIRLANLQNQNTQISILDVEGKSWYFHNVSNEVGYANRYNLDGMPDNDYVVFIKNKNGKHFQAFSMEGIAVRFYDIQNAWPVKNLTASLGNHEMKDTPQLFVKVNADENCTVGVRVGNLKKAPASIRLFSDSGTRITTIKVNNEPAYAKNWDLQKLADGHYFLYIQSDNIGFVQSLVINNNNVELGLAQRL